MNSIRVKGVLFTLFIYITAIISIQLIAPDSVIYPAEFPDSCPENSMNCTYIGSVPHRGDGKTELRFDSNFDEVINGVKDWINLQPRTEILGEWDNQIHAVFKTLIWRFPDDFAINLNCENGITVMSVYSKSRLGTSDLGVNNDRVEDFSEHMSNVELSPSECN